MRKYLLVLVVVFFGVYMFGCAKKQAEETQDAMTMDAMSTVNITSPSVSVPQAPAPAAQSLPAVLAPGSAVPLPPPGPFSPSVIEIQTALKQANFYMGEVDGKLGPKTKKAIEEFQKANNLKVDGKVGPKTWEALKNYLMQSPAGSSKER